MSAPTTDRGRFHQAIETQSEGFYYANACCPSCGFAEAGDAQDVVNICDQIIGLAFYGDSGRIPAERLPATMVQALYINYDGKPERIVEVFKAVGFNVRWDGDRSKAICVRPELEVA
jgi:Domain of unknown function (DUF6891)